ncbi:cation:proton antiporter [Campylobacter cuniculorum]|uniref:Glutathione-regulated potassium-efflux system protein KefB n=2 Tax=Campylobacter cuniculorum TaxID=374106 RepID=A0A1W6BVJ2_9BACT|nr:cation:proton antiporter [Campylobacter cuniculorum]ARJ56067.1 glutathione-regulated potassium-efflux system protein KefB [Campylobacter cuniculorum DSM 23162 = LMG 24588]QOR03568.1 cation:proton antiporter [Campylobacter cuniculorum]
MVNFLQVFLIAVSSAVILNVFLKRFELPTIIGYILTGIILSQIYHFNVDDGFLHIAEFGIVFLMFSIGLEFSLKHLMTMKKEVFLNGSLQMLSCGLVFTLFVMAILGLVDKSAFVVGFALALSSTAVVLKILNDNGDINEQYGRKALGILLFQDIAVIPLLLLVDLFSSNDANISQLLLTTFVSAVILIALLYFIGKYLVDTIFRFVIRSNSQEIFILTILFMVIGASFLAHKFGFSYSLGAFIAGVLIAETEYKHKIEADLAPFRDLLLGLFFITMGMQIQFQIVFENWLLVLILICIVCLFKLGIVFGLLLVYNNKRIALKTALSIAQIGEFSLAIFSLLQTRNMIDIKTSQILIVVAIITMIITPFILNNMRKIANIFEDTSLNSNTQIPVQNLQKKPKNHYIIFGYGRLGQEVVQRIKMIGVPYLVLESDLNLVELGISRGENVHYASAAQEETLKIANIEECAAAIITITNEAKLEMLCGILAGLKKPIDIIIRVDGNFEKVFFSSIDEHIRIVRTEKVLAKDLVQEALECVINKN